MRKLKLALKWLLSSLFIVAGIMHFVRAELFVKIVPPYIPWPLAAVYVSGVFEFLLGVLLILPKYSSVAAWGLIALLFAVFPANLHMALHADEFPDFSPMMLWIRLPLQGVLIAWAYWFTREEPRAV